MTEAQLARRGVHAGAVGHGIAHALFAVAIAGPSSPEEWVMFCLDAADEAESSVRESPPAQAAEGTLARLLRETAEPGDPEYGRPPGHDHAAVEEAARTAGAVAFRACMPKLTGRRCTQAYIACVAVGVQRNYFTGGEAKALLYTAQLALSAHPSRRAQRGRKEPK
jgi:hypothetical protein